MLLQSGMVGVSEDGHCCVGHGSSSWIFEVVCGAIVMNHPWPKDSD